MLIDMNLQIVSVGMAKSLVITAILAAGVLTAISGLATAPAAYADEKPIRQPVFGGAELKSHCTETGSPSPDQHCKTDLKTP